MRIQNYLYLVTIIYMEKEKKNRKLKKELQYGVTYTKCDIKYK